MNSTKNILRKSPVCYLVFGLATVALSNFVSPLAIGSETPRFSEFDTGIETIVWDRNPIRVLLPVGKERRIDFPVEVKINIPNELVGTLRVTPTKEGTVFFKADSDFDTKRLIAFDASGDNQYLIDVSASQDAPSNPISIYDSRTVSRTQQLAKVAEDQESATLDMKTDAVVYDEVDMVRIASRQFYGPSRLATLPPGFGSAKAPSENVQIYIGENLSTRVKASWRAPTYGGNLYVTAIEVRNLAAHEVRPDPRRITARITAMTPQHSWLAPAGSHPHDMTMWYLVSDRPLGEVLKK